MRVLTLALAALGLAGCAGPYLPPGSRPASVVQPYHNPDYARILPGTWTIVGTRAGDQGALALPNAIQRSGEIAGVKQWRAIRFTPSGGMSLIGDNHKTAQLDYHIEGNELHIGPVGRYVEHDPWQMVYQDGELFLRSLDDAQVLTLAPVRQPTYTASARNKSE